MYIYLQFLNPSVLWLNLPLNCAIESLIYSALHLMVATVKTTSKNVILIGTVYARKVISQMTVVIVLLVTPLMAGTWMTTGNV